MAASDREEGRAAARRWLLDSPETERANLAAVFSSGLTCIVAARRVYPSLRQVLGTERDGGDGVVDFAASPWLQGFRDAVVEELGEPG